MGEAETITTHRIAALGFLHSKPDMQVGVAVIPLALRQSR